MESDYRLGVGSGAQRRAGRLDAVLRGASCVVLSSLLVACGAPHAGEEGAVNPDATVLSDMASPDATVLPEVANPDAVLLPEVVDSDGAAVPGAAAQETDGARAAGQDTDAPAAAQALSAAQDKLPIIVNLALGEDSVAQGDAGGDTLAAVTARVMERLKAAMPAEDLAGVRTFGFLPAIALSADGALIARLLAMPEVQSIELDRELQPLDGAAGELTFD